MADMNDPYEPTERPEGAMPPADHPSTGTPPHDQQAFDDGGQQPTSGYGAPWQPASGDGEGSRQPAPYPGPDARTEQLFPASGSAHGVAPAPGTADGADPAAHEMPAFGPSTHGASAFGAAPHAAPAAGAGSHGASAAGAGPAAPARRRGPGWAGVTGLVALGMLVSSGLTLSGVVAYDQLLGPETAATSQAGSSTEEPSTARPASVSTTDTPDWGTVAEQVSPSAVAIQVATDAGAGEGTGVVLDDNGSILTNNHVVDGARSIQVTMNDGLGYTATVVGTDTTTDLAVIRLDSPPDDLQPATFADSATVEVGQPVMALGTPLGLENTVTTGIISAVDRPVTAGGEDPSGSDATYTSALQTDAAINPGNSGGPLIDAAGQVIGINSSIAGIASSTGQAGSIGLGFAIPSNTATMIAEQLKDSGSADHSFLGVTSSDGTETVGDVSYRGAQVRGVEGGSPAAEAGLREGDLITKVDDTPVGGAAALTGVVRGLPVDSSHTLTVVRDQDEQTLDVTLAGQPS